MVGLMGLLAAVCGSCSLEDVAAAQNRLAGAPHVFVNQQLEDGCTRFALNVTRAGATTATVPVLRSTTGTRSFPVAASYTGAESASSLSASLWQPFVL